MRSDHLRALLASRTHPPMLRRRRALTIVALTRGLALLFGALTLAWIAVDLAVFDKRLALSLAGVRVASASAFLLLWVCPPRADPGLMEARVRLALLFAIPAMFHVATEEILRGTSTEGMARGIAAAYSLVPYVMAAGIAAFPLVALESAALALLAFALLGWVFLRDARLVGGDLAMDAFWLLFLIACVCTFAAMSQVRLLAALIRQATRDPLTGCLRRESGRELLDSHFRLAQRQGGPLAVVFADLDRFKAVNDRWGHEVGDKVLAAAAATLREGARESDAVLRWGGEEFVVVLAGATAEEALALVQRLGGRGACTLPDGRTMTLSVGIAERLADEISDATALVDLADRRMYLAKQAGRNRCVYAASGQASIVCALDLGETRP
ncbi:hypothetical protein BWI17_21830 [Betaproteobacteria bacterium GR16-43]|nr:hypothetical protein BWI17_21830 [Betaproteobacteria bacterium GR16-43]